MKNKLYRVECCFVYYVLASNEKEATDKSLIEEALFDMLEPDIIECVEDDGQTFGGWDDSCLVYSYAPIATDITLGEAREMMKND